MIRCKADSQVLIIVCALILVQLEYIETRIIASRSNAGFWVEIVVPCFDLLKSADSDETDDSDMVMYYI